MVMRITDMIAQDFLILGLKGLKGLCHDDIAV